MMTKVLELFEVELGFAMKPYYVIVEATDMGDAEHRVALFTSRRPERIKALGDKYRLLTHFDIIEIQSRDAQIEAESRQDEEDPF